MLESSGASCMYFLASHGIFSGDCITKIREIGEDFLKAVVVTNSMPQDNNVGKIPNFHVVDVSGECSKIWLRDNWSSFMPRKEKKVLK